MTNNERDLLLWGWCPFCFADVRVAARMTVSAEEIETANRMRLNAWTGHRMECRYLDDVESLVKSIKGARE